MSDRTRVLLWAAIVAGGFLQGCTAFPKRDGGLANPTPLHRQGQIPVPADPDNIDHQALIAYQDLPLRYYQTLKEAKKLPPADGAIDAYVKAGAALVELDCLRWFGRVADAQRGLTYQDANWNVIRQMGTALIGIAKLHPDVTAIYGVGNTAWEGFRNNINTAFLAAPSAESVKKLTLQALKDRSDLLNDTKSLIHPKDFSTAYLELEKLADTCTYSEIRKLTTQAVGQGQGKANPRTGETFVAPSVESNFLRDEQGDRLRRFWKPDGANINAGNEKKIRDWLTNHDLDALPVTFFLRSEKFVADRQQAARDLLP